METPLHRLLSVREAFGSVSGQAVPTDARRHRICAVVVSYFPDGGFERRLESVLSQVDALVLVDNTPAPAPAEAFSRLAENAKVHIIENHANLGLAAALNQGLDHALELGCNWILTLDQDTRCYADMMDTLIAVYAACAIKPAVIGSNYFDPHNRRVEAPAGAPGECQERKTVITSGSLIDAQVARAIGGFREDYFIDQVDHEFCLRVRSHGFRVVISRKPAMQHSVGGPGGARIPFLGTLPNHSPLRKYYITRNTVVTVSEHWRTEPAWCLRRTARLLLGLMSMALLEDRGFAKVKAFGGGAVDGILGHMGSCRRKWLNQTG